MSHPSDWPTWCLVGALLLLMFASDEIGYRFGRYFNRSEGEASRSVTNTLKASVFGLVALLVGFSFSMTTVRHDRRRQVVLDEANAIGTCYLRAGLLADPARKQIRVALCHYVDVRLGHAGPAIDPEVLRDADREMNHLLDEVWAAVESAYRADPAAVRDSRIVPAANSVIDLSATRAAAARDHLPLPVLVLVVTCVLVSSLLVGHSSGQAGRRHGGLWLALNILLALVMFTVLDFDRPRRGLVRVDHTPLLELREGFGEGQIR